MYTHVHPLMHQLVRDRHVRLRATSDFTRLRRPHRPSTADEPTVHRLPTSP